MKVIYRIGADIIWLMHLGIVLVVLFGWVWQSIYGVYLSVLVLTLLSEIIWSYCLLSKWEFDLRRKVDPSLNYEFEYSSYYTYKLTQGRLSRRFLGYAGIIFITLSLFINLYFNVPLFMLQYTNFNINL